MLPHTYELDYCSSYSFRDLLRGTIKGLLAAWATRARNAHAHMGAIDGLTRELPLSWERHGICWDDKALGLKSAELGVGRRVVLQALEGRNEGRPSSKTRHGTDDLP